MRCRGLSLIEMLVALFLVVFTFYAVAAATTSYAAVQSATARSIASCVATDTLDAIRAMAVPYIELGTFDGRVDAPLRGGTSTQYPPPPYPVVSDHYARSYFIEVSSAVATDLDGSPFPSVRMLNCTIDWTEGGRNLSLSMASLTGE